MSALPSRLMVTLAGLVIGSSSLLAQAPAPSRPAPVQARVTFSGVVLADLYVPPPPLPPQPEPFPPPPPIPVEAAAGTGQATPGSPGTGQLPPDSTDSFIALPTFTPVAGATVVVRELTPIPLAQPEPAPVVKTPPTGFVPDYPRPIPPVPSITRTTDRKGNFSFNGLKRNKSYSITISKRGYNTYRGSFVAGRNSRTQKFYLKRQIVPQRFATLTGVVLAYRSPVYYASGDQPANVRDANSPLPAALPPLPVAKAQVTLTPAYPQPVPDYPQPGPVVYSTADAPGTATVRALPPQPAPLPPEPAPVPPQPAPLPPQPAPWPPQPVPFPGSYTQTTDFDGRFTFKYLQEGSYILTATREGYYPTTQYVYVTRNNQEQQIYLQSEVPSIPVTRVDPALPTAGTGTAAEVKVGSVNLDNPF
jgi:hypothetical protein